MSINWSEVDMQELKTLREDAERKIGGYMGGNRNDAVLREVVELLRNIGSVVYRVEERYLLQQEMQKRKEEIHGKGKT